MAKLLKSAKSMLSKLYNKAAKNVSSKSSMNLLHNKTLLYVVFFVSIINLILWMIAGDIFNVIVFVLVGFLTAFFSKNMIIVLVFALVISNIIKFGIEIGQEGFTDEKKEGLEDEKLEGMEDEEKKEGLEDEKLEGLEDEKLEGLEDEKLEGLEDEKLEGLEDEKLEGLEDEEKKEGMHTLGYSSFNSMVNEQKLLFSNISKMAPFVTNVDNEAKLRASLKYENFTSLRK